VEIASLDDIVATHNTMDTVKSLIDFYFHFRMDAALCSLVKIRVNLVADWIIQFDAGIVNISNVKFSATSILEQIRCYRDNVSPATIHSTFSRITMDNISQAIEETVYVRAVQSLMKFYSVFGSNIEMHAFVENQVNLAADFTILFNAGIVKPSRIQTPIAKNILCQLQLYQQQNPHQPNSPRVPDIKASDILQAINMTMLAHSNQYIKF
jgi:hypothetical protein